MHWDEFTARQPRLAGVCHQALGGPGVVLVGTVRRDGAPRISPVEPLFWERDLWLSMLWGSQKAGDLARDPRILVHSIVTSRNGEDGECKVRGRAIPVGDPEVQTRYASVVRDRLGWDPVPGRFHLFWIDLDDVTVIRYDDATGDQFLARWPAGIESVRRGTSATTVGPPEPFSDLLADTGGG
ncbi:MAG TPA: pyridoxamine 5'-phosphate oxidase family protein [Candidatus Limnocylindrales bacterium]|jgi:hypothetical protein|nr:pyridoxamine 5'-phosphate oxidase family protein [Candidatus Limnocylindrales bacterium]